MARVGGASVANALSSAYIYVSKFWVCFDLFASMQYVKEFSVCWKVLALIYCGLL